jgi:phosphoglycolate phosphatase
LKKIVILFDLDGTLIDSTEAILESFYYALKQQNFSHNVTKKMITDEIGHPLDVMFENVGVKDNIHKYVDSYKEHYQTIHTKKTILLPQAKEAVQLASSFARLAIVTTKTTKFSQILLESFGIWEYFETIIGRQEVTNPKPHPEPIYKAMENLKVNSNDKIFMIGDTKLDLIAANSAKIHPIGVQCGYGTKEQLSPYTRDVYTNTYTAIMSLKSIYSKA